MLAQTREEQRIKGNDQEVKEDGRETVYTMQEVFIAHPKLKHTHNLFNFRN